MIMGMDIMSDSYNELKSLIDYIQEMYLIITDIWEKQDTTLKINLKTSLVSHINDNDLIYKYICDYVNFLNEQSSDILLGLSSVCSYKVNARIKTYNSIEYKIQNYTTEKHGNGKIPINKCFNDLFGVRIFLEEPLTFEKIYDFIKNDYKGKYKCIDSSKLDYKATHIYFKKNNQTFQWELQIWNKCDTENNFDSHKKYKQEYTNWEKESKEGGIING